MDKQRANPPIEKKLASSSRIAVGRITRAHGVRGEVSVLVLSEVEDRFEPGSDLLLEDGRALRVRTSRPNRGRLLVTFEGVPDRTAAEPFAGSYLFVQRTDVPEPPADAFWPHDLEGNEVITEGGRTMGTITEVVHGEANDIWVTRDDGRETLIPALKDVVVSVDVSEKRVVIREVPGLTDEGS
jgi:16S rRNA processing protein RimM